MADKDKKKKSEQSTDTAAAQDNVKKCPWWKRVLKISAWTLCILITVLVFALIFRDSLIKFGVTKVGSWVTGVEVSLDSVKTAPFKGLVNIRGLRVANPAGYDKPYMLELGEFNLDMEPGSLFTDEIVINDLLVRDLAFTAEFARNNKFNVTQLTDDLKQRFPAAEKTEDPENNEAEETDSADENANQKAVLIRNLDISIKMSMVHDLSKLTLPMPISYSQTDFRIGPDRERINWVEYLDSAAKSLESFCQACFNAGAFVVSAGAEAGETLKSGMDASIDAGKKVFDQGKDIWKSTKKLFK